MLERLRDSSFFRVPTYLDNKYTRGVVQLVCGSTKYIGAGILTSTASVNSGVGMTYYTGPKKTSELVVLKRPEVVVQPQDKVINKFDVRINVIAVGSGVNFADDDDNEDSLQVNIVKMALEDYSFNPEVLLIVDAGAINVFAEFIARKEIYKHSINNTVIITPHAKELSDMFRVFGVEASANDIQAHPEHFAKQASELTGAVCLLKGAKTVIASDYDTIALPSSTNWLAQAGTGDVLTGILAGVLAQNIKSVQSNTRAFVQYTALSHSIHSVSAALYNPNGPVPAYNIAQTVPQAISLYVNDKEKFFGLVEK
ncbi:MAG: NAD(P)H-hydrate dehydratase [Bifidobacteriaceae bacterium]|jgi:hydroxyethylthiazole kinase-like uncharacterized protein yjeF|nr:NAD(P)H-hydrate dehydratase [Bifidobacteriaceae bacterium]